MTRAEIIPLLQTLLAAYPNNGIKDVKSLVNAWEMAFGEEKAEDVYKACRLHMNHNDWFPKVSQIKDKLAVASHLYENTPRTALPSGNDTEVIGNTGCDICPYQGALCIGYDKCNL